MLNQQPIEKSRKHEGQALDVHSIFYTIQGEGPLGCRPAVFLRLAGCNLQCPQCDTDYTTGRKMMDYKAIAEKIALEAGPARLVVITGGEPFRQNLYPLCKLLTRQYGFAVQIETNGTLPPQDPCFGSLVSNGVDLAGIGEGVYIVVSPKTGKVHEWFKDRMCALKYVASSHLLDPLDGLPDTALGHTASPRLYRKDFARYVPIYLQPTDEKKESLNDRNRQAVVASCMAHDYIVNLQIHKILELD